ncbi:hypothetical protein LK520_06645, partial [Blautia sp. DFI.4.84]|nr:hypothetical protein [Blautia sp. DFI.4.84]
FVMSLMEWISSTILFQPLFLPDSILSQLFSFLTVTGQNALRVIIPHLSLLENSYTVFSTDN